MEAAEGIVHYTVLYNIRVRRVLNRAQTNRTELCLDLLDPLEENGLPFRTQVLVAPNKPTH